MRCCYLPYLCKNKLRALLHITVLGKYTMSSEVPPLRENYVKLFSGLFAGCQGDVRRRRTAHPLLHPQAKGEEVESPARSHRNTTTTHHVDNSAPCNVYIIIAKSTLIKYLS